MSRPVLFLKGHTKGYVRADGTPVQGYDTKHLRAPQRGLAGKLSMLWPGAKALVIGASEKPAAAPVAASAFQQKYGAGAGKLTSLYGGAFKHKALGQPKAWHPKLDDQGREVGLYRPHAASDAAAWSDPLATATVPAGGEAPAELHGVAFATWDDAPTTLEGWEAVPGQDQALDEPDFDCPHVKEAAAGVVIQEPDGRVWLVSPTNAFGGYKNTFPKGRADDGLSLQATAIKEAFEETGLRVKITGFLGDFERTHTHTRYYTARRVGGTPADMGWESQAVRLAPHAGLAGLLNGAADKPVRDALAGDQLFNSSGHSDAHRMHSHR